MENILIIGPTYLGDIIFTTPAVKAIRLHFPDARIAYCIKDKFFFPILPVLEGNPDVDRLILYGKRGRFTPREKLRLIRELRKSRFDIAFVFTRDIERALIPYFSGVKTRIGCYSPQIKKYRKFFVLKPLFTCGPEENRLEQIHRARHHLNLINIYTGKNYEVKNYVVTPPAAETNFSQNISAALAGFSPVICLHAPAGVRNGAKQWPAGCFARLGNLLVKKFPRCKIILTGSGEETETAREAARTLKAEPLFLAGRTTLSELGITLQKCDLMVSGDTGPMHYACALKVPVIALFGGSSRIMYGPYGEGKTAVLEEHPIKNLNPEKVFEKAAAMLAEFSHPK